MDGRRLGIAHQCQMINDDQILTNSSFMGKVQYPGSQISTAVFCNYMMGGFASSWCVISQESLEYFSAESRNVTYSFGSLSKSGTKVVAMDYQKRSVSGMVRVNFSKCGNRC